MHGKRFVERFRSKNASPPRPANGTKPPAITAVCPRTDRLLGGPLEFVVDVCQRTKGRAALVVALCIYRRFKVCNSRTVTLPSGELVKLGITRQHKQGALRQLQRAGLIEVGTRNGQTARVTLIWQRPQLSIPIDGSVNPS